MVTSSTVILQTATYLTSEAWYKTGSKKMKKDNLKKTLRIIAAAICPLLYLSAWGPSDSTVGKPQSDDQQVESEEEVAYERAAEKEAFPFEPRFNPADLEGIERDNYLAYQKQLDASGNQFSTAAQHIAYIENAAKVMATPVKPKEFSYAGGSLKGTWNQKHFAMDSATKPGYREGGSRVDGAAYDPVNNELYVVSHAGHLYKINPKAKVKWSLRNHKKNLRGNDFNGVNLPNKSFRLLHQKANGPIEFSDDEGRTWANANGAFFQNSWNFKTLVTKKGRGRRIVAHGGRYVAPDNTGYHRIYISTDNGLNFSTSKTTDHLKISEFNVKICKPHNSKTIYCFATRKRDSQVFLYRMQENDKDLIYQGKPTRMRAMTSVVGTEVKGDTHFYISSYKRGIYYSSDGGLTWTQTSTSNSKQSVLEVHPTKPNICFKGYVDLNISTDYGATWTSAKHQLGSAQQSKSYYIWDLQFFRTFDSEKRGNFTFAGFDFGAYYSLTPEVQNSWSSINRGNPVMLSYDATTNELHRRVYSANQDRGVQSFLEDGGRKKNHLSSCLREANTDVLRVAIGKGGESAWFWYYYGAIGRASAVQGGDYTAVVKKQFYPNFVATSLVPSPNPKEDAVYIPWKKQLQKISFDGRRITRTLHPFTFAEEAWCFNYSQLNTKRWYAGLKSGVFMYSTDGGKSFSPSNYPGPWPRGEISPRKRRPVIATSPVDEATVYYAGRGNSFLVSSDGGKSFTNQNTGLKAGRIVDMDASTDGKFIFAACEFGGAWVFSVRRKRWYKMDGADVPSLVGFTDVQFIDATETARFATYGSGILDFKIRLAR